MQPTPSYNDYSKCIQLLRFGITCYKYNYKNNKYRRIVLQLSPDQTKILYQDFKETGNWQVFSSSTNKKIAKFNGLIYGGRTDNFKKHRRFQRRQQEMRLNPNDPESVSLKSYSAEKKEELWYPWKCISLAQNNGTTLDLTIGDESALLAFIHVFYKLICKPPKGNRFMREFKLMKIKMKLHFDAK